MTGKVRFLVVGMSIIVTIALVLSGYFIVVDQPAQETGMVDSIEENAGSMALPGDLLLEELEAAYSANQSLEADVNTSVVYDYALEINGDNTTNTFDYAGVSLNSNDTENLAFLTLIMPAASYAPGDNQSTDMYFDSGTGFVSLAAWNLAGLQEPDGSWNHNVSDTALAVYALAVDGGIYDESIANGTGWLESQKSQEGWGSPEMDAKAILALGQADIATDVELENLFDAQAQNGSFGSVADTSWAVMATCENLDGGNFLRAARAVAWLRSQDIQDTHDLALAAVAEQYYNEALAVYDYEGGAVLDGAVSGGIDWVYGIGIFVIASSALVLVIFARLREEDVLEGLRKEIYEHIEQNPGEHLAGITKKFGISSSSSRHHLEVLEWSELIVSHKTDKMRHYYPNRNGYRVYTNGQGYKEIMSLMRNPTAREIVKQIMANERSNQKDIAGVLRLHPSTVNWHANRLRAANIISKTREGKDIHYHLNRELDIARVIVLIEGDSAFLDDSAAAEGASS